MIVSVFVRRLKPGATFQDFVREWEADQGPATLDCPLGGSAVRGDGWRPARPWDEAERVTGRVSVDIFAVELPCPEGQHAGLG